MSDIFFSLDFSGAMGEAAAPTTLKFEDVIFVLEDVDAASKIITRRDLAKALFETTVVLTEEKEKQKNVKDALSLAGILNVFDGIVATPGRVSGNEEGNGGPM